MTKHLLLSFLLLLSLFTPALALTPKELADFKLGLSTECDRQSQAALKNSPQKITAAAIHQYCSCSAEKTAVQVKTVKTPGELITPDRKPTQFYYNALMKAANACKPLLTK